MRAQSGARWLVLPGAVWLGLFFVVPLAVVALYSVLHRGVYGGVEPGLTLTAYRRFLDPLYLGILVRTIVLAAASTVLALVLGFPVAWAMARAGRARHLLLFLVVVPLWTSQLVRTYAIMFLLRDSGPLNAVLLTLGIAQQPLHLLFTTGAVLAGLVYNALPFMILPIHASLEKLDPTLLEAAEALGARPMARFRRIVVPLAMPGIVAGALLVFVPAVGTFLTSDLLGGARQMLIGNLVQNQFGPARDWPFGSAASFLVMLVVLGAVLAWLRLRDTSAGQGRA